MQAAGLRDDLGGAPMLGWFVETTLVATCLAAVAAVAGRLWSLRPTIRHALWLVVLIKLATPPVVHWPWPAPWGDLSRLVVSTPAAGTSAPAVKSVIARTCPTPCAPVIQPATLVAIAGQSGADPSETEMETEPGACRMVTVSNHPHVAAGTPPGLRVQLPPWLPQALIFSWLVVTALLGAGQAHRIVRFRRRLRSALPAPDELVDEAERIGIWLGVRVPELLVVPDFGTPLLWCLGQPKLILPTHLVKTLDRDGWRGILIHELAHLRRGDHWVSRLELVAGLVWWWNPLYWWTRARLDAEAELACDAWVVWALPKQRITYAEALFNICSTLSLAGPPAPALGAAGSGRFFERRLTMILHEHVPCRLSPVGVLIACFLALFALPSWSPAKPASPHPDREPAHAALASADGSGFAVAIVDDDDDDDDDDDADDDDDDADDDDDDDDRAAARAKAREARAKAQADREKARAERGRARSDREKARAAAGSDKKPGRNFEKEMDEIGEKIGKEIESKFGPDFEKKMEELGERIGKEIESKFGPDFEKKMEALGKEMEGKFGPGSEFEKKMKAFGKEMEAKFGPGSEFEQKMKTLGKEMEGKFGPGSDFEKRMKALGNEMESKFGPDSEFTKKLKEQHGAGAPAEKVTSRPRASTSASPRSEATRPRSAASAAPAARNRARERRIAALEEQIRKLAEELKALRDDDDRSDN
jgi:beta-lactamase regulating signal transducer with metallopeptidase domain